MESHQLVEDLSTCLVCVAPIKNAHSKTHFPLFFTCGAKQSHSFFLQTLHVRLGFGPVPKAQRRKPIRDKELSVILQCTFESPRVQNPSSNYHERMLSWALHYHTNRLLASPLWTAPIFTCFSFFLLFFFLFFCLPPGWGSPHRVQQWLGARAQTIHKISPGGSATSWQKRRWRSPSIEPKSARCRSTSSHPPAERTALYLRKVNIRALLKIWLSTRESRPNRNRNHGFP